MQWREKQQLSILLWVLFFFVLNYDNEYATEEIMIWKGKTL